MTVISPWHSARADVHHNNSRCRTGNRNIGVENIRNGDGGKRLCEECKHLSSVASGVSRQSSTGQYAAVRV